MKRVYDSVRETWEEHLENYNPGKCSQIARFTWRTWGPPGSCRPQVGPMLAPWTLLSGFSHSSIFALELFGLFRLCLLFWPYYTPLVTPWWRHQMETFSTLLHGLLCREFTDQQWIPFTKASDVVLWCFLCSAWINSWVNNRDAGDLRRHRAHYDAIAMQYFAHDINRNDFCWIAITRNAFNSNGFGWLNLHRLDGYYRK